MKYIFTFFCIIFSVSIFSQELHTFDEVNNNPKLIESDLKVLYSQTDLVTESKEKHIAALTELQHFSLYLPYDDSGLQDLYLLAQKFQWKKITGLTQQLIQSCRKGSILINCQYILKHIQKVIDENELDPMKVASFQEEMKRAIQKIEVLKFYRNDFSNPFDENVKLLNNKLKKTPVFSSSPHAPRPTFPLFKMVLAFAFFILICITLHHLITRFIINMNRLPRELESLPSFYLEKIKPFAKKHNLLFDENSISFVENSQFSQICIPLRSTPIDLPSYILLQDFIKSDAFHLTLTCKGQINVICLTKKKL